MSRIIPVRDIGEKSKPHRTDSASGTMKLAFDLIGYSLKIIFCDPAKSVLVYG